MIIDDKKIRYTDILVVMPGAITSSFLLPVMASNSSFLLLLSVKWPSPTRTRRHRRSRRVAGCATGGFGTGTDGSDSWFGLLTCFKYGRHELGGLGKSPLGGLGGFGVQL